MFTAEVSAASPREAPDPEDVKWGQERKKSRQLGGEQIETRFASNPHQEKTPWVHKCVEKRCLLHHPSLGERS